MPASYAVLFFTLTHPIFFTPLHYFICETIILMSSIIQVQHLIKTYKKASQNAVDDISFEVQKGKLFAFLGPNGAGKTTTISISLLLSKTSGEIIWFGTPNRIKETLIKDYLILDAKKTDQSSRTICIKRV